MSVTHVDFKNKKIVDVNEAKVVGQIFDSSTEEVDALVKLLCAALFPGAVFTSGVVMFEDTTDGRDGHKF